MSVNGRPFRPDPTSYQMTGIPCGNPLRYKSKGVIRMVPDKSVPFEDQQIGIPGKGTLSEAEIEFQKLVKNQLDTSFDYAQKKVNFTSSAKEDMVGSARGFLTLNEFLKVSQGDKKTNEMRGLGFTDTQINHLLEKEGLTTQHTKKRKFAPHPDFVKQGIDEMLHAKEKREAELEAEANAPLKISRHRQQLEAAILQGKAHLPLAHLYVKSEKRSRYDEDENEPQLLDLEENSQEISNHNHNHSPASESVPSSNSESVNGSPKSETMEAEVPKSVVITKKVETLTREEMEKNRLSAEEIQKQFSNYERGIPSKVLYVKNLDKQITPEDLVSIFVQFQEEGKDKIGFKLMSGKMKGQAFITFHDEQTATAALEVVHGYMYNNKPIIIQYGKAK